MLDLRLPAMSGRDVCREIKQQAPTLPIIVLSAASDVSDKVLLLELGADDYVTKPFSPRELLARVRAALRRTVRTGDRRCHRLRRHLRGFHQDGSRPATARSIGLTAQEFKTLKFLVQNAERVITRDELLNEVWGYQNYPSTRTVDNHILKLRQKLEKDPANPVHFRTVHGMGYKFVRDGEQRDHGWPGESIMVKLRMRTKFLLSMLLISAGLTCTSLLLVRRSVQKPGQAKRFSPTCRIPSAHSRISSGNANLR